MNTIIYPAKERGYIHQDWLEAYYSFSFAGWHDPERMGFGALRVLNDDIIGPSNGFGWHPHADMEIVTIVLQGTLSHRDSTGGSGEIRPGDVQVMTAGKGITHMEYNNDPMIPVHSLQLWFYPHSISLEPRYDQAHIPLIPGEQHILVTENGEAGSLQVAQNLRIVRMQCLPGETMEYTPLSPDHLQYCFVIEGEGTIGGESAQRRDAVGVVGAAESIKVVAGKELFDVLILDVIK